MQQTKPTAEPWFPKSLSRMFDTSELIGQFVLSYQSDLSPQKWPTEKIADWILGRHPALPVMRLKTKTGASIGWLLGYPIDKAGRLLKDKDELAFQEPADASESTLEDFVYSFGGRFLAIFAARSKPRMYLDPCGSLSAVYCKHQQAVASTPGLIPYDERAEDRTDLIRALGIPNTNAMYPVGMTPRFGIERVLPNHYLNLHDWRIHRHWPRGPLEETAAPEEAISTISKITKRIISAIVQNGPTYLRLTAGRDSRMLLACARKQARQIKVITAPIKDDGARIDCDTAHRIAKRMRLIHFVLPRITPKERDMYEWMFRTGCATGEVRGLQCATMYKHLKPGYAMLLGNVGEVARGYYYRPGDSETSAVTVERLLEDCHAPLLEDTITQVQQWLNSVPPMNTRRLLDLFYIEQRLGCWAGLFPYAECDPGFTIFPLCHRDVIERMIMLPLSYHQTGRMASDIIRREWPELLEFPFNQAIGGLRLMLAGRKALSRVKKAVQDPRRAFQGLTKITRKI